LEGGALKLNSTMIHKVQLSVVIASYKPGPAIFRCLESLEKQIAGNEAEVIVVDSSNDFTVQSIRERFPWVRVYGFPQRKYCGDARNFGISVAKGEIIAFIDADCEATSNWVQELLKAHGSGFPVVGGAIVNGAIDSAVGWAAYFCEFSKWMPQGAPRPMKDIAGATMSYKKKFLEAYGPFLESTYCSDTEFHWRLNRDGLRPFFYPSIVVSHMSLTSLKGFLRHEYEHGRFFASVRVPHEPLSKPRIILLLALWPFIPLKIFFEITACVLKKREYLSYFIRSLPFLSAGVLSWCLGEAEGYWRGSKGRIPRRVLKR
jgi:GT2 family glycosyltransferase